MKKETIVFFSAYHLPHLGGIERYTENLGLELIKKGYNVVVVTSNYNNLKDVEIINGIEVIRLPIYSLFSNRYPILKKNDKSKKLLHKLDDYNIKAVIVNARFYFTSLLGAKYGSENNIPVFQIEHGSQHLTVDNKILDFFGIIYEHVFTWKIKKYINYYYGVSEGATIWQKHFKIKSDGVWYNSINEFGENVKLKKNDKILNITYAGRILKQKGIERLVKTFDELNKNNVVLNIAGDGNLLEELKNKYTSNKNIKFYGKLNFDDLTKLYAKTDIFVYAPIWPEGLPTGILEAGYMKCAVIASPYGGTKEIIEDKKNGIMITNEMELKNALKTLIDNQELRKKYSLELFKKINNKFLWKVTAEKIVSDINEKTK